MQKKEIKVNFKHNLTNFIWIGTNKKGEKIKGEMVANSSVYVKLELKKQGIDVKTIRKKSKQLFSTRKKKITSKDISIFSRQLATMLTAGIPLVQAFEIVARGQANPSLQTLINEIKNDVEAGIALAETLGKHPKYFNELFCNLVSAGEQSGSLEIMLDKIASYLEKIETIKGKIKKALFYPTAVIIVAIAVTTGLLLFVVPQFESLFKGFGADLPMLTLMVVKMSKLLQKYWWLAFGGLGGFIFFFIKAKQRSKSFSNTVERLMLKLPVIGEILTKAAIARFSRTLSITFKAGLPLVEALKSVSGATGNIIYNKAALDIRDDVSTGQQMQLAMQNTQLFPNMVIQMVAIGEESGALEEMLSKVADFYEEEVNNAVDGLTSLLEPLIMAVLGVLIGGLVIAMYLPIFKLGSVV